MLAIRLPETIEARLIKLAELTGRTKTFYAREAILTHLDDLEDMYITQQRLKKPGKRISQKDLGKSLAWNIEWDKRAVKELKKLDKTVQQAIFDYLKKVAASDRPRSRGKALSSNMKGLWRYRVLGQYRIVCSLEDHTCTVLVVRVAHRREVYR